MEVEFADDALDSLETNPRFTGRFSRAIVRAYRRRMQQIRAAADERDFYAIRSLHFEKLSGRRQDQYSMRLNDQYRLILEIAGRATDKVIIIVGIEDYH
jgi:proteic killer suppression protein